MNRGEIMDLAREALFTATPDASAMSALGKPVPMDWLENFAALVAAKERDRICNAIKAEDNYCVDNGDYMLDSDDCIAVAQGTWERPDFNVEVSA